MDKRSTHLPVVGKNLIEILMFSMYSDSLIIYREYVQNAFDAIVEATNQGVLSSVKQGQVSISIDTTYRKIVIHDNGIGIPVSRTQQILLNIADSHKDGISLAGQYGIGRLVGAKYCKRLIFKTSAKGENKYTEVIFDNELAHSIIFNKEDRSTATQVIERITSTIVGEENSDSHYFEVKMEDVSEHHRDLLNVTKVTEYLKEVAPIDYMLEFKNMLYNPCLPIEFQESNNKFNHVRLTINDEIDVRKRYGLTIEGTGDNISSLQFFKFDDSQYGLLAWGWYAITPFSKQIPAADVNRGMRLRKCNIQIGTSKLLNEYFKEPRGNNYFYGEIHAVHPNLRPNSSRDGLTHTPEAIRLYEYIGNYFADLQKLYYLANEVKNISRDIHLSGNSVPQNEDERNKIREQISSSLDKFSKAKAKYSEDNNIGDASQKVLSIYSDNIEQTLNTLPLDILPEKTSVEKDIKIINSDTISDTITKDTVSQNIDVIIVPTVMDIFEPLGKKYNSEDIKLIRKIFAILSQNCPVSQRQVFETMKVKAIKQLCK